MKHWKIGYAVKRAGNIVDKYLIVEAATIDVALVKAHKAVAAKELPTSQAGDMFVITDVGIMDDDVF